VLTGDALHRELLARFAAPQPSKAVLPLCAPIEHEGGVIAWSPSHLGAFLLRVVGERVIQLGVARDDGDAPKDALVRWLAAFDPRALDLVSDTQPLRYLEGSPIAPLTGHAVVHPSLAGAGPSQLTIELLTGRLYRVSFVHRSEIAEDMDAKWAKAQLTDLRGGPARAPCSAFRSARSKPGAKKPAPLTPARPQALASEVSIVQTGDVVEIENAWRHRLRLARPTATWLDTNESRVFVGLDDANAIARAFVDHDTILRDPIARDVIDAERAYLQLEACARDLDGDVEPVDVVERSTNTLVARLFVRRDGDVLHTRYQVLDPRLGDAHVRAIVDGCYLHALTRHHHRGKASTIRITPNDGVGGTFEYAYPPAKVAR
jgi:hypothetical protein